MFVDLILQLKILIGFAKIHILRDYNGDGLLLACN